MLFSIINSFSLAGILNIDNNEPREFLVLYSNDSLDIIEGENDTLLLNGIMQLSGLYVQSDFMIPM